MHFKALSKGQYTKWGYFWELLKFQIFLVVLDIPDIFFFLGGGVGGG